MEDRERAELAATFDDDADGYERGRPDYPPAAWELVLGHLNVGPRHSVLEIGAGTGQATTRLLATGASVHAVEPGPALAAHLQERFHDSRFTASVASLEETDLEGPFDAAAAATSFHWVDPDRGIPILSSLLRPGAPICLWWNVYRDPAAASVDPVDALVRSSTRLPNTRGLNGILDELDLPRRLRSAGFSDVTLDTVSWTGRHDEDQLVALFQSFSDMRKRDPEERDTVIAKLRDLVARNGGSIERPYTTPVLRAFAPS